MKDTDERYTPAAVTEPLVRIFGAPALDPCTAPHNPVGARNFYTKARNGLGQNWLAGAGGGWSWLNPPFSEMVTWTALAIFWARRGLELVMLTPQDSTPLWHDALDEAATLACPLKRRVRYVYPEDAKQPKGTAMFATTLWYFGHRPEAFAAAMHAHGHLYAPGRFRNLEARATAAAPIPQLTAPASSPADERTEP